MATKRDSVSVTLSAAVGHGGTFTASYPAGRGADDYVGGTDHYIYSQSYRALSSAAGDFSITFGTSSITVNMTTGLALANGSILTLALDRGEIDDELGEALANPDKMTVMQDIRIDLGTPATADADGVCASQSGTAATAMTIAGALASGGVATFDVPRNVVAAWTNTATLTVTGTDEYGATVVETSASGTSMAGKKAFKTVTSVVPSANITSATVGTGDVFGLPVYMGDAGAVLYELQDGATATAGAFVAGDNTTPSATTGDVRGTYDPNAAANGSREFVVGIAVRSRGYKGATQFSG